MKKILIVNSFYAPTIVGGAEMYTQTLAESLVNNYDVYVLSTNGHTSGTILREKINGVHVYRLPLHNIYWPGDKEQRNSICKLIWHTKNLYNRKQSVQIKNIIREINPDLVHTQNLMGIGTEIWRIVRKNKIPLVHTIHDYQLITPVTNNFINKVCCLINRKRSKYVDFVTSVSNYTLNEHLKKSFFKKKEHQIIPNSFVHKRLKRNKRESKQPLKACFIGQIEEIKGIYLLFKLLEKLNSSILSRLVVCGTGSKVNEVREFSKKDNRLEYKGHLPIENLQEIIAQSDILLVPSVWEEPFGRVIIESYNQGTPVIAANVGGISEIVYSKKWLFNKNDIDDFVSKVYHFYSLTNVEIKREIELSYKTSNFYRENITQHIKMYDKLVNKI